MESEPKQLKWNELAHTEGEIPWRALEDSIEALIQTPSLWKDLARRYDKITITQDYFGFEELYIPFIFAKAAPKLDHNRKIRIIPFLLEKLSEAGQDDNDYLLEAYSAACGSMGPVILPFVMDAIDREEDTVGAWVFLWSFLKLAAHEKDPAAKKKVIDFCAAHLHRALRDELDISDAEMAAEILADLGCSEYAPLVKKLMKKSVRTHSYPEYRQSFQVLNGDILPFIIQDMWEKPLDGWLERSYKAYQTWHQKRIAEMVEDEYDEGFQFYVFEKLSRRFAASEFAQSLEELDEESIAFIFEIILNYAWSHNKTTPENLNEAVLKKVLTDILPRKAVLHEEAIGFVPEIAAGMLRYFQECEILPNGAALAEKVLTWSEEIIRKGKNRKLWDAGKKLSIEALENGLNPQDPDTLRDILSGYMELEAMLEDDTDMDYTPNIPIKDYIQKTGRNDPCPCGSGRKYKKCCGQVTLN